MRSVSSYVVASVLLLAGPAAAATSQVNFAGNVSGLCSLALGLTGGLGVNGDGDLTSTGYGSGTIIILSVGSNTLTLDPPEWVQKPAEYTPGDEEFLVSTAGLVGLGLAAVGYQDDPISTPINTLPLSVLMVDAKITNSLGFPDGDYQARVVVTCT